MSSLAATQADGNYVPPEYFESGAYRRQSKNQFAASQEVRLSSSASGGKRQRGHNQWLQNGVVRFELPYKGICGGCGQSIGRGTRYNARKTTAGSYFTTPVYQFEMSCRQCQHPWIVRTNPRERGFDYCEGIKLQAGQETNLALVEQQQRHDNDPTGGDANALARLETVATGKQRALTEVEELQRLQKLNEAATLNDADNNARIRQTFRRDRKDKRKRLQDGTSKGWRNGMEVLPPTVHDTIHANDVVYGRAYDDERKRLSSVRNASIFSSRSSTIRSTGSPKVQGRRRPRTHQAYEDATASPAHSGSVCPNASVRRAPAVADEVPSASGGARAGFVSKLQCRLGRCEGCVSDFAVVLKDELSIIPSAEDRGTPQEATFGMEASTPEPDSQRQPPSSFLEMMAAYESDEQ